MTDIVERLRDYDPTRANSREAAAEIERLRAALKEIAAYPHSEEGGEIARAAMEPKPWDVAPDVAPAPDAKSET